MANPLILIPARMQATRLPGKPLADILGEPMIVRVWRRAIEARVGDVVVATDDERIVAAIEQAGGRAVMTSPKHQTGSDRIKEAADIIDPKGEHDIIVNVQGDFPTLAPTAIAAAVEPLADPAVDIATLAGEITDEEEKTAPSVVKLIGSEISPAGCGRSISPGRRRLTVMARSIIMSASTPIAAARSIASSRCRSRRLSCGRSSSNCARSRTACASTP